MLPQGAGEAPAYDDEDLLALGQLLQQIEQARLAAGRVRRSLARTIRRARRVASSIRDLPKLSLQLTDSAEGRKIEAAMRRRRLFIPGRTVVAVLELPQQPEDYLKGKKKQAVRTGLNQARKAGLWVKKVEDDVERRARAQELVRGGIRPDFVPALERWAEAPDDHSWFVMDATGSTLAVGILTVDGPIARLAAMIGQEGQYSSAARYLVSAHCFMEAVSNGVTTIVLEDALFVTPGLTEFQRRLGFRPMSVRIAPRRR